MLNDGDPRMLLLQWGWGSQFSVQSLQIIISFFMYTFLSLWLLISVTHSWYLKRWNILKKMNSLKKGEGVPLLKFEGAPRVPLLNFRVVPGPTFKLWGGSRVLGPSVLRSQIPGPGVLVPLLHHAWNHSGIGQVHPTSGDSAFSCSK